MDEIVKRLIADTGKEPAVEVVEGPASPDQLSPVQLERIARSMRNTELIR